LRSKRVSKAAGQRVRRVPGGPTPPCKKLILIHPPTRTSN